MLSFFQASKIQSFPSEMGIIFHGNKVSGIANKKLYQDFSQTIVWKLFSTIVEKSGNYKRTVSIA